MAMTGQAQADEALDQIVGWMQHFDPIEDPRQSGKVDYPLTEILLLVLLAVLGGAEGWVEVATFGRKKLMFLRRSVQGRNTVARSTRHRLRGTRCRTISNVLHRLDGFDDQARPRHRGHRRQDASVQRTAPP
jgi:hypothetical protein